MNRTVRRHFAALLAAPLVLAGCAGTKVDLSKYRDADLKEAEVMPSRDQLNAQRTKIVVLASDDNLPAVRGIQVGASLDRTLENELSAAFVEVVDRNLALKLADELRLAESRGSGSYSGPAVAQFAVRAKLTSAEYGATYVKAYEYTDKKGKKHVTPARFDHRAQVVGSISLYELPSLRLVLSMPINGKVDAEDPNTGANPAAGATLLRAAAEAAVLGSVHELKNVFAPKGYVVERRVDAENRSIFKVTMGRAQGADVGNDATVFSLRRKTNALTGQEHLDEVPVVEARVSDQVAETESWIIPQDKEAAGRVRLGDFVKVKYSKASARFSPSIGGSAGASGQPAAGGATIDPYYARTIEPVKAGSANSSESRR